MICDSCAENGGHATNTGSHVHCLASDEIVQAPRDCEQWEEEVVEAVTGLIRAVKSNKEREDDAS